MPLDKFLRALKGIAVIQISKNYTVFDYIHLARETPGEL